MKRMRNVSPAVQSPVVYQAMGKTVYQAEGDYVAIGDDPTTTTTPTPSVSDLVDSDGFKTVGAAALAYHGYKRSGGSILWTAFYALMGHWKPQYALPVAYAQGYGEKRVCTTVKE